MKLVISTQCYENYGSHNWDGEGDCPQYWKAKGGEFYIVENFKPSEFSQTVLEAEVARIAKLGNVEADNDGWREQIIDWSVEDDDFVSHDEQMYEDADKQGYDRDVRYWDTRIDQVDGSRSLKFRGFDGNHYLRTWAADGVFTEVRI